MKHIKLFEDFKASNIKYEIGDYLWAVNSDGNGLLPKQYAEKGTPVKVERKRKTSFDRQPGDPGTVLAPNEGEEFYQFIEKHKVSGLSIHENWNCIVSFDPNFNPEWAHQRNQKDIQYRFVNSATSFIKKLTPSEVKEVTLYKKYGV